MREYLSRRPTLPLSLCVEIAVEVALLLEEIHTRGQSVGKIDASSVRIQHPQDDIVRN